MFMAVEVIFCFNFITILRIKGSIFDIVLIRKQNELKDASVK